MSEFPESKFIKETYMPKIHPAPKQVFGTVHFNSPPLTGFEKLCIGICFASIVSLILIYFILN